MGAVILYGGFSDLLGDFEAENTNTPGMGNTFQLGSGLSYHLGPQESSIWARDWRDTELMSVKARLTTLLDKCAHVTDGTTETQRGTRSAWTKTRTRSAAPSLALFPGVTGEEAFLIPE